MLPIPSRMVPRVLAPPLTSFGSVPFRVVIVFGLVCCCVYVVCIAVHSTKVVWTSAPSTMKENPPVVLLPFTR